MPTQEYSSAGKTFSMSRWAMRLPMVARRSPAITTPPGNVTATIVVPCGASVVSAGAAACAGREQLGGVARQELGEGRRARRKNAAGSRPEPVGSGLQPLTPRPSARTRGRTPRRSFRATRRSRPGSRRCPRRSRPLRSTRSVDSLPSTSSCSASRLVARFCPPVSFVAMALQPPLATSRSRPYTAGGRFLRCLIGRLRRH